MEYEEEFCPDCGERMELVKVGMDSEGNAIDMTPYWKCVRCRLEMEVNEC